jgi:hypothetical protein
LIEKIKGMCHSNAVESAEVKTGGIVGVKLLTAGLLAFAVAGCATLRETDPKAANATLERLKAATALKDTVAPIEELRDLYYGQVTHLKRDMLDSGDNTTNLGILAGIAAASRGVSMDVFKGLGLLAGGIGVYDLRYKPAQQRQYYLDATQALGCIAEKARQLANDSSAMNGARGALQFAANSVPPSYLLAANALSDAPETTYRQVVAVHRRLNEKLLSAVTTQGLGTIRDSLVKDAVEAQKRADEIKSEAPPMQVSERIAQSAGLSVDFTKARDMNSPPVRQLSLLEKQLVRLLADGTTYKSDLAICAADFLK